VRLREQQRVGAEKKRHHRRLRSVMAFPCDVGHERGKASIYTIMPAPTVLLVDSSMTMKAPVLRLRL